MLATPIPMQRSVFGDSMRTDTMLVVTNSDLLEDRRIFDRVRATDFKRPVYEAILKSNFVLFVGTPKQPSCILKSRYTK